MANFSSSSLWFPFLGIIREPLGTKGFIKKENGMITMEEAVAEKMVKFVDDRHFCTECVAYKANAYMGNCNKNKKQYPKLLNRCNMFASKVLQTTEAFWETGEKPFWEI